MGRGRVEMKRIENKISRQVTFSKRRGGLIKKANEISVLCDADVALIVFSSKGKLFEYSNQSSMDKILERYERYCYAENQFVTNADDSQSQANWWEEYPKLAARMEILEKNLRNYMGEDLNSLSLKEVQTMEQQIETSLKRIRARKNQLMQESISLLHKKEKGLQEENRQLAKKIKEKEKAMLDEGGQWEQQQQCSFTQDQLILPSSSHTLRPLTIGGSSRFNGKTTTNEIRGGGESTSNQTNQKSNIQIPAWMLTHVNQIQSPKN